MFSHTTSNDTVYQLSLGRELFNKGRLLRRRITRVSSSRRSTDDRGSRVPRAGMCLSFNRFNDVPPNPPATLLTRPETSLVDCQLWQRVDAPSCNSSITYFQRQVNPALIVNANCAGNSAGFSSTRGAFGCTVFLFIYSVFIDNFRVGSSSFWFYFC